MTNLLANIFLKHELRDHNSFEFVQFRKNLLHTLIHAQKKGKAVGIYADALGNGMFVTGIAAILEVDGEHVIYLKANDVMGATLLTDHLPLSEIKAICAFDMVFRDPQPN